jgi:hypothetical protein
VVVNQQVIAAELYNILGEVANPPWVSPDFRLRKDRSEANLHSCGRFPHFASVCNSPVNTFARAGLIRGG